MPVLVVIQLQFGTLAMIGLLTACDIQQEYLQVTPEPLVSARGLF
jgi:hypothetical protein